MCRVGCVNREVEFGVLVVWGGARERKKGGARGWKGKWVGVGLAWVWLVGVGMSGWVCVVGYAGWLCAGLSGRRVLWCVCPSARLYGGPVSWDVGVEERSVDVGWAGVVRVSVRW